MLDAKQIAKTNMRPYYHSTGETGASISSARMLRTQSTG
jgi:hypothetical protein